MGATSDTAEQIGGILSEKYGHEIDLVDLKGQNIPELEKYDNVVIGSSIRMGKWNKHALKFLHNNFEGKKVAVFVSSSIAGGPKQYDEAFTKFVKNVLAVHSRFELISAEVFGGCIKIFGKTVSDNRDIDKIHSWADELGKKFAISK